MNTCVNGLPVLNYLESVKSESRRGEVSRKSVGSFLTDYLVYPNRTPGLPVKTLFSVPLPKGLIRGSYLCDLCHRRVGLKFMNLW